MSKIVDAFHCIFCYSGIVEIRRKEETSKIHGFHISHTWFLLEETRGHE